MTRFIFLFALFISANLLTACGSAPWNPQGYAGGSHVALKGCDLEQGVDGQLYCDVVIYDFKEKTDVNVEVVRDLTNNTVKATYKAKNIAAFDGQDIRGNVDKEIAKAVEYLLPEITKKIIDGIKTPSLPNAQE